MAQNSKMVCRTCHSFIKKKIDFLKAPTFAKSTQMALELPKVDICKID